RIVHNKKRHNMKKVMKKLMVAGLILALPVITLAQTPPHPNGGNAPGGGNIPVGGGAPIDGGIVMLMIMGAAYGSRKIYQLKK
ncbi:MAG: hypothetical protein JW861_01430, partial [Bacteroidales bacterium]|nr:hypothetical protein [Bacteroidales bacterium]